MDSGWRFHLGDEWGMGYGLSKAGTSYGPGNPAYSDASWRTVDLPHDWVVELPFDPTADTAHGYKPVGEGFPQNSMGWYRRSFDLPASDAGKRLWLEFDGVYRDATVIVNGWFVAHHEGGYNSFRCDITDVANCGGANVVSVRVDASQAEGWFYEGAGIYRHVWLVKTAPLSVAPDGIFAYALFKDDAAKGPAEVHVQTRLVNAQAGSADAVGDLGDSSGPTARRSGSGRQNVHLGGNAFDERGRRGHPRRAAPLVAGDARPLQGRHLRLQRRRGRRPGRDDLRDPHGRLRRGQGLHAERRALHAQGNVEPPGPRGGGLGPPRRDAVFPHRAAEGDGLQRLPHRPQPADAGAPGRLRQARHDRHGREPAARQRRAPRGIPRGADPPRLEPRERLHLVARQRGVRRAGHPVGQAGRRDHAGPGQADGPDAARHVQRRRRQRVRRDQRGDRGARLELPRRPRHGRLPQRSTRSSPTSGASRGARSPPAASTPTTPCAAT